VSEGAVLITDPVGDDASVIVEVLGANGFASIAPARGQDWRDLAAQADGLIVNLAQVDAGALGQLARCRVIARLGVGVDNINLGAARERGVVVTNVPEYCREEVSDHVLALMLALLRKIPLANADVQDGSWAQLRYRPIRRINTLVLGLVGFGRLARTLAGKAAALGMRVIATDPYAEPGAATTVALVDPSELLAQADVVSIHAPLTPATRGMIDARALLQMKRGAILINTSRGELIDEEALAAALDSGQLSGAGLDVVTHEPLARNSALRGRRNVLLTPHMAFYSEESLLQLQRTAAEDVVRVLSGQPPHHRVA
jgi:D-3-phosphoglycerate dehydrogenase